jgi:hypothetical protein
MHPTKLAITPSKTAVLIKLAVKPLLYLGSQFCPVLGPSTGRPFNGIPCAVGNKNLGHGLFGGPFNSNTAELSASVSNVEVQNDYVVCVRNNILQHLPIFRMLARD